MSKLEFRLNTSTKGNSTLGVAVAAKVLLKFIKININKANNVNILFNFFIIISL